ncbi:MAG: hypothetical protein EXR75_02370 [Myxococcales bacterium]|nr:hypothetical protein [Myxococcales bacterium]
MRTRLARVTAILLMATTGGCVFSERHDDDDRDGLGRDVTAFHTTIDSGEMLSTELGSGAGVFVEYARGGVWRIWTSCDTALTGLDCIYQIEVASYGRIDAVDGIDLEPFDTVDVFDDESLTFYAETDYESDAVEVFATPGALLTVSVALDGLVDPSYFVWIGNGAVNEGAPASPVVFQPDAP